MTRGMAAIDGVWTSMNTTGTGARLNRGTATSGGGSDITSSPSVRCGLGESAEVVVALADRLDVVDDEVELAVGQDRVDPAEPFGSLRPGEERDDHADGQRSAEAEAAGRRARREAKLLHDRQDPVPRLGVDDVLAVQRPGGGRDAHPGLARDVADRDCLLGHGDPRTETGYMRPVTTR